MVDGSRATFGKLFRLTIFPLSILAVFEVLALGQPRDWISPRIWITEAIGTLTIALLWTLLAVLARRFVSERLARRFAVSGAVALVAGGHVAPLFPGKISRLLSFLPPVPQQLTIIVVISLVTALVLRLSNERLARLRLPIPFGLVAVVLWVAFKQAEAAEYFEPSPWPSLLVPTLYLVGVIGLSLTQRSIRFFAVWALVALAMLHALSNSPQELHTAVKEAVQPSEKAPIILIVIDTLRADALEYGDPASSSTPMLAKLAQQADVYPRAVSNASWTLPGHSSIFTGRTVSGHRTDATLTPGFVGSLPKDVPTIQQILHAQGYATHGVIANPVVGPGPDLVRGFTSYRHPGRGWLITTLPLRLAFNLSPGNRPQVTSQLLVDTLGINRFATANEIVDRSVEIIEESSGGLYLFVNLMDVHRPYPPAGDTPLAERVRFILDQLRFWAGWIPELEFERKNTPLLVDAYSERARFVDQQLGRLFASLRSKGWWDDATIVVTADHGEAFFENPALPTNYGHHGAYESAVRIPLLIKKPGQSNGALHTSLVQQADILPTILDAVGLAPVPGATGRVLPSDEPVDVLTEWHPRPFSKGDGHDRHYSGNRIGVYRDHYKFVLERDFEEKLFDLQAGPWETVDVMQELPELSVDLRKSLYAQALEVTPDAAEGVETELDAELEEQLRALGYIQ